MAYVNHQSTDKRAIPRKGLQAVIRFSTFPDLSLTSGRTEDISPLGVKVNTRTAASLFHKGVKVYFIISNKFLHLQGEGRIIWTSTKRDTFGIQFTELLDEEMERSIFLRFCNS